MIGAIAASQIAAAFGWRMAFMVVGLPGLATELLLLDRDNPRSLGWVAQTLRGRLARSLAS